MASNRLAEGAEASERCNDTTAERFNYSTFQRVCSLEGCQRRSRRSEVNSGSQRETNRAIPGRADRVAGGAQAEPTARRRAGAHDTFGHQHRHGENESRTDQDESAAKGTRPSRSGAKGAGYGAQS